MKNIGIDAGLAELLKKASTEELDYGFVMDCLKNYRNPRVKLNDLLKKKALIRVKKGLYVFGKHFTKRPFSLEVLANMMYGPSYLSLEWACQYYRLLPEKVTAITSLTTKRSKQFSTPVGLFTYSHAPLAAYSVGITSIALSEKQHALFATKEKALVDLLIQRRGKQVSIVQLKETLFEDLRVLEEDLDSFSLSHLKEIHHAYPHSSTKFLIQLIQKGAGIE